MQHYGKSRVVSAKGCTPHRIGRLNRSLTWDRQALGNFLTPETKRPGKGRDESLFRRTLPTLGTAGRKVVLASY
jgi:hypothetical protein